MAIRVVTPADPADLLLPLAVAKRQLGVEHAEDDVLITGFIRTAQRQVESEVQRRYIAQELEWVLDTWHGDMVLPLAPGGDSSKIEIVSVSYADQQGQMQVLDPATMYWDAPAGATRRVRRKRFAVWPLLGDAAERVVIRFAITSTPADASPGAVTAMSLLVAHYYAHREAVVGVENRDSSAPLPFGVEDCLDDERWEVPTCG